MFHNVSTSDLFNEVALDAYARAEGGNNMVS